MFKVVSHTRSGMHLMCKLLHQNFDTGMKRYEDLDFSHTRVPTDGLRIHVERKLYGVALSMWYVRDHLGYDRNVSFSDFIRRPLESLYNAMDCEVVYNGKHLNKICPMKDAVGTLPQRWLDYVRVFRRGCMLTVEYEDLVSSPYRVMKLVSTSFALDRKQFSPVHDLVGWQPVKYGYPEITEDDAAYLESFQCQL